MVQFLLNLIIQTQWNEDYGNVNSDFGIARGRFQNHGKDADTNRLNVDPIIDVVLPEDNPTEKKWRAWLTSYLTWRTMDSTYVVNGIHITMKMVNDFDNAFQHFVEWKEENIEEVNNGADNIALSKKQKTALDLFFPGYEWPDVFKNWGSTINAMLPYMAYSIVKCFPNMVCQDNKNAANDNEEVHQYYEYILDKKQKFLNKLKEECKDYLVKVTARVAFKSQVQSYVQAFKQCCDELTDDEQNELISNMMAIAI